MSSWADTHYPGRSLISTQVSPRPFRNSSLVMGKTTSETDLYRPLHDYLVEQGYTVRGEVKNCDIAAVKDGDLIVIELKRALNIPLLAQAVQRQKITDSVYVAVPRPSNKRKWMGDTKGVQDLLRRLEVGLIFVSPNGRGPKVEIMFHPLPHERRRRKQAHRAVLEEVERRTADFNEGGSCRRKLVTAYRENAIHIACCLDVLGPSSPKALRSLGAGPKTLSILYTNVYGWFERIDKGVYALSAKGRADLGQYPELVEHYRQHTGEADG